MAYWKARVELLLNVVALLFLSLAVEALQGKMCQNSLPSGGGRTLGAKISWGRGRPWGIFLVCTKLNTFLLSNSANGQAGRRMDGLIAMYRNFHL